MPAEDEDLLRPRGQFLQAGAGTAAGVGLAAGTSALTGAAATTGALTVTAVSGAGLAGGSTAVGIAAAGGASLTIPVAGWVVGAALLAVAGGITIANAFAKKGAKRGLALSKQMGIGGMEFGKEFYSLSKKPLWKVKRRARRLDRQGRRARRGKKKARLAEQMMAAQIVAGLKQVAVEQDTPIVAGDMETKPAVAETNNSLIDLDAVEQYAPYALGALGLAAVVRILTR